MAFEWPDVSKNQLMQVGLGLLGSGFGRNQTNPFQAAGQGLVYGQQQDKADAEEARVQEAAEREERLQQAWAGMFGAGSAPAPDTAGMSVPGAPTDLTGAFPRGPQIASAGPGMAGMGSQTPPQAAGAPGGNPMLAGLPPQAMPLLAAMGPEKGAGILMDRFNQKPEQRRIVQGPDGFNYYEDTKERVLPGVKPSPENPTDIQRNLVAAGFEPGTPAYEQKLQEYLFKPSTQIFNNVGPQGIDYGKPPEGMAWARDGQGKVALSEPDQSGYRAPIAVPISGGPVETKRAAEEAARQGRDVLETQKTDLVLDEIDRSLGLIEGSPTLTTGTPGKVLSYFAESDANALTRRLGTIKANIGFDRLQQMRETSPTGGSLGNISEGERGALEATQGDLTNAQRPEDLSYNLTRVNNMYLDAIHGTPAQRAALLKQGKVTQEQLDEIEGQYRVSIGSKAYTMEDLRFSAEKYGKTVDEVIEILKRAEAR